MIWGMRCDGSLGSLLIGLGVLGLLGIGLVVADRRLSPWVGLHGLHDRAIDAQVTAERAAARARELTAAWRAAEDVRRGARGSARLSEV